LKFLRSINITLINLLLITPTLKQRVYTMLDFLRYLLFTSTLLDNYSATHLINSKELLKLKSFIKVAYNKCIEAGSFSLPILRYNKRVIKKVLNNITSLNSEDLTLSDIIVVKGFYINIVSKARLNKVKV
jgi:hypothetical protein